MRSQSGSSLSMLAFLVPLLGVPLMAIFGVPQFVPVIASSVSDPANPSTTRHRSQGVGESATAAQIDSGKSSRSSMRGDDERLEDLFRPTIIRQRDSRPLNREPTGRDAKFFETTHGEDTWLTQTSDERRASEQPHNLADLFGEAPTSADRSAVPADAATLAARRHDESPSHEKFVRSGSAAERSEQGLTWRDAVQRLNELGIEEFRLEPGRQLGEFYFACEFAPDRDARITRRFEAEAKEPLLAVAAVLRQIDEWLPRR